MESSQLKRATSLLVAALKVQYSGWDGSKQFSGTPERIARMYSEFCWSQKRIEEELEKQFKLFADRFDEMLVVKDLHLWTLCPHHLLPCSLRVYVGYIPQLKGKVLGLSKFSRVAEILAKRPVLQERYTAELADILMAKLKPKGVGVTVYGVHGCMASRGVKQQHAEVVTAAMRGVFLKEAATRAEFLAYCRDKE